MPWQRVSFLPMKFFKIFLLGIFLIYISNTIPKVPHTPPPLPYPLTPTSRPWHSPILRHIKFASPMGQWASLSTDGRLGHLLIHMQLETRAPGGYWLVHTVVPPIRLQIPSAPILLFIKTIFCVFVDQKSASNMLELGNVMSHLMQELGA
jgi:hypothetical protein